MFISDFAIRRPIVTTVTMIALVVFGIFALAMLQTDEFPDVQNPVVVVSIPYPGASPESVEREVIEPIEEGIASISGRDKISEVRNDLPPEMEEPILTRFDPADFPIVSLTMSSKTMSGPELTRLADPPITRVLRGIPGVAEVQVIGGVE